MTPLLEPGIREASRVVTPRPGQLGVEHVKERLRLGMIEREARTGGITLTLAPSPETCLLVDLIHARWPAQHPVELRARLHMAGPRSGSSLDKVDRTFLRGRELVGNGAAVAERGVEPPIVVVANVRTQAAAQ